MGHPMSEFLPSLSAEGQRRREQILAIAIEEARRRRRRRSRARGVAVAVLAMLALAAIVFSVDRKPARQLVDRSRPALPHPAPPTPADNGIVITRLMTEPGIASRMSIKPTSGGWTRIGDEELLNKLADAHHPAGLAYINQRPVLLFENGPSAIKPD